MVSLTVFLGRRECIFHPDVAQRLKCHRYILGTSHQLPSVNSSDTFYNSLNFNILLKVFLKMQFYKIQ